MPLFDCMSIMHVVLIVNSYIGIMHSLKMSTQSDRFVQEEN